MLMHAEGRKIILFPAWPKEWDVEFKLHAPMRTTIEGILQGGKLVDLEIKPNERLKDLEIMEVK